MVFSQKISASDGKTKTYITHMSPENRPKIARKGFARLLVRVCVCVCVFAGFLAIPGFLASGVWVVK
jgi:hypothetical protein